VNKQQFLVAEREGTVLGIMGIQTPTDRMLNYTQTDQPIELITAMVSKDSRGEGIGKLLVNALLAKATSEGAKEVIVNSGPRYRLTGWPFWQKQFGVPVAIATGYYGPGGDAMVWRKALDETK
jgi:GNAT superfamily N-acetyltransferase